MDATTEMLAALQARLPKIRTEPNTVVFREGQSGDCAYVVSQGEILICTENHQGVLVHLTTLRAGQLFGELSLLNNNIRTATALTKSGCELLVIRRDQLDQALHRAEPFLRFMIEYLASRVLDLTKRVDSKSIERELPHDESMT